MIIDKIRKALFTFARKLIFGSRAESDTYIADLRKKGMIIGERVTIYEPTHTTIDATRPYLISIGDDVKITKNVTILTHGFDWNVIAGLNDIVIGSAGRVVIGNNVFVGMNTTILKNVRIGDNVIIGAGSLVNCDIPSNCVAAGNPARVIMSIDEYIEKRYSLQVEEAYEIYDTYVDSFGKEPPIECFDEFFWLFNPRNETLPTYFCRQMKWHDRYEETLQNFINSKPYFESYSGMMENFRKRKDAN